MRLAGRVSNLEEKSRLTKRRGDENEKERGTCLGPEVGQPLAGLPPSQRRQQSKIYRNP